MPLAPQKPCAHVGCSALVPSRQTYCAAHHRARDQQRRHRRSLTYAEAWWRKFRLSFIGELVSAGIPPICGATLPGGPPATQSRCRAHGFVTGEPLHLHHEPPLTDAERQDRSRVMDRRRLVVLCESCHNALQEHRV